VTRGEALLAWYGTNHRDLPWRHTRDPYRILVSEVMLQQTQVERVVPIYERFVERFPTVHDLAAASLADAVAAWSGLGYNARARRLRDAARIIVAEGWPDPESLERLPGVGPYTAAAVGSFAFGADSLVIDTNVKRVIGRWRGKLVDGAVLRDAVVEEAFGDAADWNQAVMELGATVCRPRPACDRCPVTRWCADPTVYEPPAKQSQFEGSDRQVRGAVIRALGPNLLTIERLSSDTGFSLGRVRSAVASLANEGMVESGPKGARIAR
jgi:A/G-specific adenine glycosylase